jgi:TRAP-type mannitol/chloroaromatic compound transport system permease small subunit
VSDTPTVDVAPPSNAAPEPISLRLLHGLGDGMNAVGTAAIFALMLLIVADICGRFLFNAPIPGVTEIVSLSIVGIVFLQIASTLRAGRLTRSDAALNGWRVTRPLLAKIIELTSFALGATLLAILAHASWPPFWRAWTRDEYVGALGTFTAPTWPVRLMILIGSIVLALQFVVMLVQRARRSAEP